MTITQQLRDRVIFYMEINNLTYRQIARTCDVPHSTIHAFIKNNRDIYFQTAWKIMDACGLKLEVKRNKFYN